VIALVLFIAAAVVCILRLFDADVDAIWATLFIALGLAAMCLGDYAPAWTRLPRRGA
jgi:4-amino-4-deoxy-L-arabinose transferase-like glycosyltransferase